jgi:hypothetical protein
MFGNPLSLKTATALVTFGTQVFSPCDANVPTVALTVPLRLTAVTWSPLEYNQSSESFLGKVYEAWHKNSIQWGMSDNTLGI